MFYYKAFLLFISASDMVSARKGAFAIRVCVSSYRIALAGISVDLAGMSKLNVLADKFKSCFKAVRVLISSKL